MIRSPTLTNTQKCAGCRNSLPKREFLRCITCRNCYDLDCANVGIKLFYLMEKKSSWKCKKCFENIEKSEPGPERLTTVDQSAGPSTIKDENSSRILCSMREEILTAVTEKLPKIICDIMDKKILALTKQIQSMEESVKLFSDKYDEVQKSLKDQNISIKKLENENKNLKSSLKNLEARLSTSEAAALKQEQWSKQQNLEIIGIPEFENESLIMLLNKLANYAKVELKNDDIEFAHRVRAKRPTPGKPRPIIIRFRERFVKDSFLSALRKKRGLNAKDIGMNSEENIFINEHLTIRNKQLLSKCKSKAKECGYKYVWTKNCRIYIRKNDTSPYILISTEMDLEKLF